MSTLRSLTGGGLSARVDSVREEIFELVEALRGEPLAGAEAVDALFIAAHELGVVQGILDSGRVHPLAVAELELGVIQGVTPAA
jgi:hypothetical protein